MVWSRRGLHGGGLRDRCARDSLNRIGLKKCQTKRAGRVPFDKGSGTTVPSSAWVSIACVSVLLQFAVAPLGFSLQEKKQADRASSRKGPVLRITWNSDGMILASTPSNQTVKPLDGAVGKPRTSLEGSLGMSTALRGVRMERPSPRALMTER